MTRRFWGRDASPFASVTENSTDGRDCRPYQIIATGIRPPLQLKRTAAGTAAATKGRKTNSGSGRESDPPKKLSLKKFKFGAGLRLNARW